MRARRLAWGSFAACAGLLVAGLILSGMTPRDRIAPAFEPSTFAEDVAFAAIMLVFGFVGALVAARVPRNPVGWLLLAVSVLNAIWIMGSGYAYYAYFGDPGALPAGAVVIWLGGVASDAQWGLAVMMLLLFPDGHLPSRRWRPAAVLVVALAGAELLDSAFQPGPLEDVPVADNPLGIDAVRALGGVDFDFVSNLTLLLPAAGLLARRRHASPQVRRQLDGFLFAQALVAVALAGTGIALAIEPSETVDVVGSAIVLLLFANLAVSLGVAVLKHRLYDVELVIRRTLVYGALTATLGGAYLGLVLVIGLTVGESDLAVAASTLAVAALFRPARARIQAAVDRRFFRRRYDAARTLAGFGARLRDQLDLDALSVELRAVVGETMQPAHVSLWLRRKLR